ncbi:MAG: D-alanyl-D-alanine carboxypeptidase/D-alanyl-D-alanine-endopeptidase [Bryobacteraceae bacterium]|jgi:D-alanyl-D-alanine carboxypeptidase/D-alanyl-D-alanine-endopeptidase (penicillin-binding protein 4)
MPRRLMLLVWLALPLRAAGPMARIREFLDSSPVAQSSFWGIRIVDLAEHRLLFERNSNRLFLPASNAKLFTTALALTRLGADFRYQTRVVAPAAPDADGCVSALRLVGDGDPNLSGRTFPYRVDAKPGEPLAAIDDLAAQVAAHGVRCVTGDVIGDDTAYVWEPYPDGWDVGDPVWDYGAAVSALSINDNTLTLTIRPGAQDADAARIDLTPPVDYYQIENRVRTGGRERNISIARLPGTRELHLWGSLPLQDPGDQEALGIDDPALYAADALRDALLRHGVTLRGAARALHRYAAEVVDLKNGPSDGPEPGVELAHRDSAPLLEDLRLTDKISQNLHAEMDLLAVARARRRVGSREAGLAESQAFLDEIGVDRGSYSFADGSGLSRLDLVTPAAVVRLLAHLYRSPLRDAWIGLLPVAGRDGTLHARFAGSPAVDKIFAKTGSLSHVAALSGYARSKHGMLAFSILVNNFNRPGGEVRAAIDQVCALMLE